MQLYHFIIQACEKLDVDGQMIVSEEDGTVIEDGSVLKLLNNQVLMLLAHNEKWLPPGVTGGSLSTCSTETALSSDCSFASDDLDNSLALNVSGSPSNTWKNFEIPWHNLSKSSLADLEKGIRNTDTLNKLITATTEAVRDVSKYPGSKAMRILAKKIGDKYPHLQDVDEDGVTIGSGYHTLFKKLLDRNNYLNRPHKRPTNTPTPPEVPPNKIKKMLNYKAGENQFESNEYILFSSLNVIYL